VSEKTADERIQMARVANSRRDKSYLIEALADPDVRSWAARFLGRLGAVEAIPALLRLLRVNDPKTRSASADALGMLHALESVPDLISLSVSDPDVSVRTHAITALSRITDPRAQPALVTLLDDSNWMIRESAAHALGLIGDQNAIEPLKVAAANRRFFLRGTYRKAIREIRSRTRQS
jgi:HEAT repeat protein